MTDQIRDELTAQAARVLANHEYTELVNANGVEVWRCKQPGTRNLQFDICVTVYGISMFGDIDGLLWSVGANYGINFLRHPSDGYLHEKLEKQCKEVEIDKDAIFEEVIDCITEALADRGLPEPDGEDSPKEMIAWLKTQRDADESGAAPYEEWVDFLEEINGFEDGSDRDVTAAYDLVTNSEDLLERGDLFEIGFTKPTRSLWQRLYYVRHAANAIMAIKEKQQAEAA